MLRRDIPIEIPEQDEFDLKEYVNAVSHFIRTNDAPLTISVQGEWGSGKTSFMKMIEYQLCHPILSPGHRYEAIWLNTWDLFLENNYNDAVQKLVLDLFIQMEQHFHSLEEKKRKEILRNTFKHYFRTLSNTVLELSDLKTEVSDRLLDKLLVMDDHEKIGKKKQAFNQFTDTYIHDDMADTNKAFLIFVDDLDRLEPKMAITLLEALKNFFDLKNCIFILAIDYEVVARGVALKYGSSTIENRNISKDFFDKIIQLPFVMPVAKYNIEPMVMGCLRELKFFEMEYDYRKMKSTIITVITLTTQKNPRAIKRLMNMAQLMLLLDHNSLVRPTKEFKVLELLLLSIQLSFPTIYKLLLCNEDYTEWKKNLLLDIDNRTLSEYEKERFHLDKEWKEIIYLLALKDSVMKNNYSRIYNLLDIYATLVTKCAASSETVSKALGMVNMVCVTADSSVKPEYEGKIYDRSSQTQFSQGDRLIDRIDFTNIQKVLDVGCGNGKTTIEMWKRNMEMQIYAFDSSESQIGISKQNYADVITQTSDIYSGAIYFYQMDALSLADKDCYDLIFSNATLHWITRYRTMYQLLFDSLKSGGQLCVHQGGFGSYRGLHAIVRKAIHNLHLEYAFNQWDFPVFYPTKAEMEEVLEDIGFTNIHVESYITDGEEYTDLIENFEKASLIFYRSPLKSDIQYEQLVKEYYRICKAEKVDKYTHRLYIFAHKP